jgi:predicted transcriptional regulator
VTVPEEIVDLLSKEGALTLSKIATKLARNPGGIRSRLLQMAASGRLIAEPGPDGWTVYRVPPGR